MEAPANGISASPLEQIRQAEAEVTRRTAAAREAAETRLETARREAAGIIRQAREAGRREGQARYAEVIARTEEEAELVVTQARDRAQDLRWKGKSRMEAAVSQAIHFILGLEGEARRP